jgi:hypothetical protein
LGIRSCGPPENARMTPKLDDLRELAVAVAPELSDVLSLEIRGEDWPAMDAAAVAFKIAGRVLFGEPPSVPLLLHEVAHLLPVAPLSLVAVGSEVMTGRKLAAMVNAEGAVRLEDEIAGHDAAWHRRALHLAWRARREGVAVDLEAMHLGGWNYEAPPVATLLEALGDEPAEMADWDFGTIDATPAPPEFVRAFDDARGFYRGIREGVGRGRCA